VAKNDHTFQSVRRVWRVDSRIPSSCTRRGDHGWPTERKYHRSESAPKVLNTCHGSITLPRDFDIFWPSPSTMWPTQTTLS